MGARVALGQVRGLEVEGVSRTPDQTVTTETAFGGLAIIGEAFDLAGNKGTDTVTVKLDKAAPSIEGNVAAGKPGNPGWYTGPVTVHFTCADALSGVTVCPKDEVINSNGAGQTATGKAIDVAGNTAFAPVSVNIDQVAPTVKLGGVDKAIYTLGDKPTPTCSATDEHSRVASCTVSTTGGNANGVGEYTVTATATDKAGNTATDTAKYRQVGWIPPADHRHRPRPLRRERVQGQQHHPGQIPGHEGRRDRRPGRSRFMEQARSGRRDLRAADRRRHQPRRRQRQPVPLGTAANASGSTTGKRRRPTRTSSSRSASNSTTARSTAPSSRSGSQHKQTGTDREGARERPLRTCGSSSGPRRRSVHRRRCVSDAGPAHGRRYGRRIMAGQRSTEPGFFGAIVRGGGRCPHRSPAARARLRNVRSPMSARESVQGHAPRPEVLMSSSKVPANVGLFDLHGKPVAYVMGGSSRPCPPAWAAGRAGCGCSGAGNPAPPGRWRGATWRRRAGWARLLR
jgi:hypothetical protein